MKEKLMFAAEVLVVIAVVAMVQKQFQIPVIGQYLPGGAKA